MRIVLTTSLIFGVSAAFRPLAVVRRKTALGSSYLDGLNSLAPGTPSAAAVPSAPSSASYLTSLNGAITPPTAGAAPNAPIYSTQKETEDAIFSHAPLSYFNVENMSSKGPRGTADWGTPQDATRKLDDDGSFRVGAWYCSEGGWPSPNPKAHTEIFYVLEGHGCLGDADGAKHYFGPGDTVIIPKGHTGRWDVYSPIHKVWAVNDHPRIEEISNPIRVVVEHYHKFAPQYLARTGQYYGEGAGSTFYNVGPTQVGVWTCDEPCSFPIANNNKRSFFHMLEGVLFITDSSNGSSRRCVAGDTVMLPAGFTGHVDVIKPVKKLWTDAQ
mmetsp:Transcript_12524/g.15730  ORF Transcript_12524/g.15730 Transcript_12524/m.15730 type:complete len:327 (-) Transcript_12524:101-1081(-)|eukprot:CAMPEP_0172513950 /NCGR_PEP_ID=MMETSP1066-20121228/256595_1 /TAXON_ID=671091 /ORGANISM="Coscinodiscus wailesii, Strain CCMP2513" /LENGTH=326 /DNA_ID=CAMNT_0013294425 /DNA_START=40 /DNA_END=1020 /DNA_ORIENTATION=+